MQRKCRYLFILGLSIILSACSDEYSTGPSVVSVASNGQYAITSHDTNGFIVLWDIKHRTYRIISRHGNVYSAYFIKHTPYFMWQDLHDSVHIQDINGRDILNFHNFPTYGEVMTSDLKHYFASDINWSIAAGYGKSQTFIKTYCKWNDRDFIGYERLLNLTLSLDDKYLVSSGVGDLNKDSTNSYAYRLPSLQPQNINCYFNSILLWKISNNKPIFIFPDNAAKTFASISTDNKYIVGADEDSDTYVWDAQTGKRLIELDDVTMGRRMIKRNCDYKHHPVRCEYFVKDGIIAPPKDYDTDRLDAVFSVKFIDMQGDYLKFVTYKPYAILYNVHHRQPIKYFHLSQFPATVNMGGDYSRDEAIDTAPEANILVIGQRYHAGIILYKFDRKKLTLTKIWSPTIWDWRGWLTRFFTRREE